MAQRKTCLHLRLRLSPWRWGNWTQGLIIFRGGRVGEGRRTWKCLKFTQRRLGVGWGKSSFSVGCWHPQGALAICPEHTWVLLGSQVKYPSLYTPLPLSQALLRPYCVCLWYYRSHLALGLPRPMEVEWGRKWWDHGLLSCQWGSAVKRLPKNTWDIYAHVYLRCSNSSFWDKVILAWSSPVRLGYIVSVLWLVRGSASQPKQTQEGSKK